MCPQIRGKLQNCFLIKIIYSLKQHYGKTLLHNLKGIMFLYRFEVYKIKNKYL